MAEGTFTYENQWRGLYAGRPEEQKLVNVNALGTLIGEHASLLAEVEQLRAALERVDGLLADPAGHPLDAINFARDEIREVRG